MTQRDLPSQRLSDMGRLVVDLQYQVAALGYGGLAPYDRAPLSPDTPLVLNRFGHTVLPNIAYVLRIGIVRNLARGTASLGAGADEGLLQNKRHQHLCREIDALCATGSMGC